MIARLIGGLVGVILPLAGPLLFAAGGAYGAWWWDHDFAGVRWGVRAPFTSCCFVSLPAGLAARDATTIRDLAREAQAAEGEARALSAAIRAQNAAVSAQAAASVKALARAEAAVARYRGEAGAASTQVTSLAAPIAGEGVCARIEAIDARFMAALK